MAGERSKVAGGRVREKAVLLCSRYGKSSSEVEDEDEKIMALKSKAKTKEEIGFPSPPPDRCPKIAVADCGRSAEWRRGEWQRRALRNSQSPIADSRAELFFRVGSRDDWERTNVE